MWKGLGIRYLDIREPDISRRRAAEPEDCLRSLSSKLIFDRSGVRRGSRISGSRISGSRRLVETATDIRLSDVLTPDIRGPDIWLPDIQGVDMANMRPRIPNYLKSDFRVFGFRRYITPDILPLYTGGHPAPGVRTLYSQRHFFWFKTSHRRLVAGW